MKRPLESLSSFLAADLTGGFVENGMTAVAPIVERIEGYGLDTSAAQPRMLTENYSLLFQNCDHELLYLAQ